MNPSSYGFVSTYPPTECGLATFTAALRSHLAGASAPGLAGCSSGVIRLVDRESTGSPPEVVHDLVRGSAASRRRGAAAVNGYDVAVVQHEYGIYGGPDGDEILDLMDAVTVPTIAVLHTVLVSPSDRQRSILEGVAAAADAVVTMTRTAHRRLRSYDVDMAKASVIPHGAHVPEGLGPPRRADRPTILTWGLLGPGKGIEWAIEALVPLRHLRPAPRYLVLGKTHPNVLARDGEAYREALMAQADALGVAELVEFDRSYRSVHDLGVQVRDADVILLPYDSPDQVTSGVLIEAVAAGKPVISSRFPHAVELLSDGVGLLVPHRNPAAITAALEQVLTDAELRTRMGAASARLAPGLGWPAVAGQYRALGARVLASRRTNVA